MGKNVSTFWICHSGTFLVYRFSLFSVLLAGNTAKYTVNKPLGSIMGTFFRKILGLPIYYLIRTLWSHDLEHCKHTDQFFLNEPLGNIVGTFFGKILGFPMDYLMGTLNHMTWSTVNVLGISCAGNTAMKLAWEILNVIAMYWMGFWWVLYPFSCDVLAVYLLSTPALAPSVTGSGRWPHLHPTHQFDPPASLLSCKSHAKISLSPSWDHWSLQLTW